MFNMTSTNEKIKKEISELLEFGQNILSKELQDNQKNNNKTAALSDTLLDYQDWYTKAISVLSEFAPERLEEFKQYYENKKRKKMNVQTYAISDFLLGYIAGTNYGGEKSFNDFAAFIKKFSMQITILKSVEKKIDSILGDIKGIIEAEFFDDELEAAKELLKKNFYRASGALAGVTLERHLRNLCNKHKIKITKKNPCISDYNDALKKSNIFDVTKWRFIQHLGDLRNLCDHAKSKTPEKEDIEELLKGIDKVIKTY